MDNQRAGTLEEASAPPEPRDDAGWDDEREIRYSLTSLGELTLADHAPGRPRFRGFGPCVAD